MNIRRAVLLGLMLALAAQFAFARDETGEGSDDEAERVCVNIRTIRSYDAFTNRHIYVQAGSNNHYLFTMKDRCYNLRSAHGITIKDVTNRVCADGFGEIAYRDRMGSIRRIETCLIDNIEEVESKEDAETIVEARETASDE